MKEHQERKSKNCPGWCSKNGCIERVEYRIIDGKEYLVWVSYCKALAKIEQAVLRFRKHPAKKGKRHIYLQNKP